MKIYILWKNFIGFQPSEIFKVFQNKIAAQHWEAKLNNKLRVIPTTQIESFKVTEHEVVV